MRFDRYSDPLPRPTRTLIAAFVICAHAAVLVPISHSAPPAPVVHAVLVRDFEFVEATGSGTYCPASFQGFGFTIGIRPGLVTQVVRGYVAERSGLRVGDVMSLNGLRMSPFAPDRIGDPLTFEVQRGTQRFRLTMKREKICHS